MPQWLQACWLVVLAANLATFGLYGFDKWQSRRNGRRIRERTLLWWTFATGWVGAWVAMSLFRHKTAKMPFRRWAILWTLLNPFWLCLWRTWQAW